MERTLRLFTYFKDLLNSGHSRSIQAKKNIVSLFLYKGLSICISLLLIPLTVDYVNPTKYGVWVTISSIIGWFTMFDIGFGNGLRNKFAESVAKGKHKLARVYVSTTYAILCIIVILSLVTFGLINPFLEWNKILNAPEGIAGNLSLLIFIVFVFFCLQFVLQLITTVMTAKQEPAKASFFNFLGSVISLITIYGLTKTTSGNLLYLAIALSAVPVLVLLISSLWFYRFDYKQYAPAFKFVKFEYSRDLMSIGIKFFIVQIGALVLFQTDNIIITQLFGPRDVTTFNIALKLFSVITMVFNIVITPIWSAFTDAYANKDLDWIKRTLSKLKKFWVGLVAITIFTLLVSPFVFKLWMGDKVLIPFSLSVAFSSYIIVYTWQTIHVFFLNGIGKITLQLYLVIFSSIINIPLALFLGKYIGLAGITASSTILFLIMGSIFSIQVNKIINEKAKGIWAR